MAELHIVSTGRQRPETFIKKVDMIYQHVDYIHIRERDWTAETHVNVIHSLTQIGVERHKIIINDRVDVALTECVGGVQLASHSINIEKIRVLAPSLRIGCSVHSLEEALHKQKKGADYLIYGHIFETASKEGVPPRGLEKLRKLTNQVTIPVIAIGGITPQNTRNTLKYQASGVAILSGILLANNPTDAVQLYKQQLKK